MSNVPNLAKVSVIIPVYNTKREYFEECIQSVLNQTYKNIEIIIIDDGSKKEIAKLCDIIAAKDDKINVVHKQNEGVSVARNIGIEMARGEWITFVDSDDILVSDGIEKLIELGDSDVIVSTASIYSDKKAIIYNDFDLNITKKALISEIMVDKNKESSIASPCNKLYNRRFLMENGIKFPVGIALGEDGIFNILVYSKANKITLSDKKMYIYRVNENSVTQKYSKETISKVNKMLNVYKNDIWKYIEKDHKYDYYYFVIRQLNYICIKQIFNKNADFNKAEKIECLKNLLKYPIYQEAIINVKIKDISIRRKALVILAKLKLYNFIPIIYNRKTIK